ncbi:MAG: hypothetical protein ACRDPV_08165 [Gaiellaceae bacterium]
MEVEIIERDADRVCGIEFVDLLRKEHVRVRILQRLEGTSGQGVLGVVGVIGLFGVVLAVAMPAYMGFQGRKADKQAQAGLLAAIWTAEAYRQKHHGSYVGMDTVDLLKIDPRVAATLTVASARRTGYCLTNNVRGNAWSIAGPYQGEAEFTPNATCA